MLDFSFTFVISLLNMSCLFIALRSILCKPCDMELTEHVINTAKQQYDMFIEDSMQDTFGVIRSVYSLCRSENTSNYLDAKEEAAAIVIRATGKLLEREVTHRTAS
ncbi:MAG: hypothetical protein Ta2G_02760 [Termitinemataceae bacterium]|nr:MAG: hypothetical protein Ta2G_02760 [Termitinemataceae bacterium]